MEGPHNSRPYFDMDRTANFNRSSIAMIGGVAGLVAGLLIGPTLAQSPGPTTVPGTNQNEHTISVTGTGTIHVTPDMADVQLGVQVTRDTVRAARDDAADAMNKVLAALRALGIADADLQTSYLNIGPFYDYNTSTQRISGYQVSNVINVHVRDLTKLADVIDGSVTAGATTVNGVTFDVADRAGAERQAREAAVRDARAHADTLAGAAAVSIVGIVSISESTMVTPWPYPMAARAGAADMATPVLPGTSDVSLTVSVVYLIQ
jgi:uncharacterized protein